MSKNSDPLILLDSDVIRHFISGNQLNKLSAIYPSRFAILDKVKNELCRSQNLKPIVESFISTSKIIEIPFPTDMTIIIEYAYLCRSFGEGESACMAVAKHQQKFIASSNLKDIGKFCQDHKITYLTTMDILDQAFKDLLLTKSECNQFVKDVLAKGSKLPFTSFDLFLQHKNR